MDDDEFARLERELTEALAEAARWNGRAADLLRLFAAERDRRARPRRNGTVHPPERGDE